MSAALAMRSALVRAASLAFIAAVRSAVTFAVTLVEVVISFQGYVNPCVLRHLAGLTLCFRVRTACLGVALLALTAPAAAAENSHPLAALAERAANELVRIAAGRPIQVDVPEERTGMGGMGLDLVSLVETRLRGRAVVARSGPRVRLQAVLGRSASRMFLVGRVTEQPGGALVDVIAVSAEADPDVLELAALPRPPRGAVEVVSSSVSAPTGARVLDLAFVDDDRLVVLLEHTVALYRRDGEALLRLDHRSLEVSAVVRAPAGVVVVADREAAFWVSTNRAEGAVLFTIEDGRLQAAQHADALPWPGSPQGARFHPGTNTIDVSVAGLGSGPHLRAGAAGWAIAPDGRLGVARTGWTTTRVGSAAAVVWAGVWIASSAKPPAATDALLVLNVDGTTPRVSATFPVAGTITGIGARARGNRAFVAAATAEAGVHRLILMEVARDER